MPHAHGFFGKPIWATGPLAAANSFRFSTKYQDAETDLLYYGYRYYSPSLGRWLSRDPIGEIGGVSLYCFVGNSACGLFDPVGNDLMHTLRELRELVQRAGARLCERISRLTSGDPFTCICGLIGFADLFTMAPPIEQADCVCNLVTTLHLACQRGISASTLLYAAITYADCASVPVAAAIGMVVGMATGAIGGGPYGSAGGALLGVLMGLTPAGSMAVDLLSWFGQNAITQGTPLPEAQVEACCRLIGADPSDVFVPLFCCGGTH